MSEELKKTLSQEETEYTVHELIQELIQDDSWEPNPEYRGKAVGMLMMSVFPVC